MDKGLQVHCQGAIWQTLVTLNEQALSVSRYHLSSRDPFPCVHVEVDLPVREEMGVFAGVLGVLTPADKTALEAFLGTPIEVHGGLVPIQVCFARRYTGVRLAGRVLPYVTTVDVWADFKEGVTWIKWSGWPSDPTTAATDAPELSVTGHLLAAPA